MGRSRGNLHSNDEVLTQRSSRRKKKKNVSSENAESSFAGIFYYHYLFNWFCIHLYIAFAFFFSVLLKSLLPGQETSEVKRALYHCNYCNKDITGKIRIKCAVCPDFDLCVECFTVGAELYPHKCNHPYRVMNDLSFPLLCPDWSADEEILLLEGIDMYGFYWEEVAKHVGTKTKEVCVDHYTKVYLDSPVFPLPDMSHAVEKSREELSASAKCPHPDDKQGEIIATPPNMPCSNVNNNETSIMVSSAGHNGALEMTQTSFPETTTSTAAPAMTQTSSFPAMTVSTTTPAMTQTSSFPVMPTSTVTSTETVKEQAKGKGLYTTAIIATRTSPGKSVSSVRYVLILTCVRSASLWEPSCASLVLYEEILLLEGIDMYGFHWEEVVKHVGTKTKEQCIDHYTNVYLKSPVFPLPDMSHVAGKDRKDLLAEDKKGASMFAGLSLKEKSTFSPSTYLFIFWHADPQQQRSSKGKKKVSSKAEGPSLAERSGYNSKRHEFDQEYDNDAEQMLAEIEFKDTDTADERELKLRMIRIYTKRVEERKRRKDFVIERNLLNPNPFEKDLSTEERALCRQYDAFMRFHSKKDHEELLRTVISEHRTLKRIQQLKEARAAGCRTSAEADRYLELKRRREAEEASRKAKESAQEKRLCAELRLPPPFYLKMQEVISRGVFSGKVTKKADAHRFFKIDPTIVDKVYDMLVKKGLAPPP
ncbi:hypothetical protein JRO89_XSUnG0027300 [Xanthoceras sorbifolium]|uniref:Transcriptional adapter n=1 Tax=Xanthoceras sorbifolium TaxID=99658 RepID=A0ABQ8H068_9ROSI|nr:hypothetical protein JRO89_XSUnG0027300 [Xanthoceras sorbifolium]